MANAIDRRPLPCIIEALDDNGLEAIQKNFEAIFSENTTGFRLVELEQALAAIASGARFFVIVNTDGTISLQSLAIPVTDGGTGFVTYTIGDLLYADSATSLAKLADVAAGAYLRSGGVGIAPLWSTLTLPNTATIGDLLAATGTNATGVVAAAAAGKLLRAAGAATLPAYSTFTIPDTFAQGDVVYGSASNTLSALAKDTNATRSLTNTGASNSPAWAQVALATGVSGDLPYANLTPATAISTLLLRGSAAGAGDWQEGTLGSGLTMTGTVLSAAGGTVAGSDTQVQFNDGGSAFGGDAGLVYNKTTDKLTVGSTLLVGGSTAYSAADVIEAQKLGDALIGMTNLRTPGDIIDEAALVAWAYDATGVGTKLFSISALQADSANAAGYNVIRINTPFRTAGAEASDLGYVQWGNKGIAFWPPSSAAASAPGTNIFKVYGAIVGTTTLGITGITTLANDLVFSDNKIIRRSTSDGSDNGFILISGSGAGADETRGAYMLIAGNEQATQPGFFTFGVGNAATSQVRYLNSAGSAMYKQMGADGTVTFTASDNTTAVTIGISATQANITGADKYVSFTSTSGEEANVVGTGVLGVIAYNTFTGAHKTIVEGPEPEMMMLLEMTGTRIGRGDFPQRVAPKEFLPRTRLCTTRGSKACFGVYAGADDSGMAMALAIGTGWIMITNTGPNLQAGDYLISSDVPGHAELQLDDIKRASTVASVSESVRWAVNETVRRVACRYLLG